jgi:hypothetical protein
VFLPVSISPYLYPAPIEPFEANYVLDVAERGIRDMLAVTTNYQDRTISIPEYKLLQRKVSETTLLEARVCYSLVLPSSSYP